MTTREDALYEFAIAQEVPDAALLDDFCRRYPEHQEALVDLAVAIWLYGPFVSGDPADLTEEELAECDAMAARTLARLLEKLEEQRQRR
jgi:hypothetical protein